MPQRAYAAPLLLLSAALLLACAGDAGGADVPADTPTSPAGTRGER